MVTIDDATNRSYAKVFEGETTTAVMGGLEEYVGRYGMPRALSVNRSTINATIWDSTVDEALANMIH